MALHKIKDFYPDYRDQLDDQDIIGYSLYSGDDKVGSVDDLLVDDEGKFRYLVINTGAWIFGKKVLLPIGRSQIDYNQHRVYATGLSRNQVENLPEYDGSMVDYDNEERVRNVYRGDRTDVARAVPGTNRTVTGTATPATALNTDASLDATPSLERDPATIGTATAYDRNTYSYDRDPDLYDLNNQQTLRLYEERLIANKTRQKTGEVTVGKHVETETVNVSVPIEKERVVIERVDSVDASPVAPGTANAFQEGEVARIEVYEESPDIRKEAFVREEVRVRKEVDRDTVQAEETVRKERLDVDKQGNPDLRNPDIRPDRR